MTKFACYDDGHCEIEVSGSVDDVAANIASLICILNDKSRDAFEVKNGFVLLVIDAVNRGMSFLEDLNKKQ